MGSEPRSFTMVSIRIENLLKLMFCTILVLEVRILDSFHRMQTLTLKLKFIVKVLNHTWQWMAVFCCIHRRRKRAMSVINLPSEIKPSKWKTRDKSISCRAFHWHIHMHIYNSGQPILPSRTVDIIVINFMQCVWLEQLKRQLSFEYPQFVFVDENTALYWNKDHLKFQDILFYVHFDESD